MLTLQTKIATADNISGQLVLPYELREKSRLRATLTSGEDVAVFTVRGTVMRHGDLMLGNDGRVIEVVAAAEPTYKVECETAFNLLRCAFHLGNRHTQAQVGEGFLRIRKDPVLKEMLQGLGAGDAATITGDMQRAWLAFIRGDAPGWDAAPAWKHFG